MPSNLSLQKLRTATSAVRPSLESCNGGPASDIRMSDFLVSAIGEASTTTSSPPHGSTFSVSLQFSGEGRRFDRIKSNPNNYTWTWHTNFTPIAGSSHNRSFRNDFNPGGQNCSTSTSGSVTVKFYDGGFLNGQVTGNYNSTRTINFTIPGPPRPVVNVVLLTAPPPPCVGGYWSQSAFRWLDCKGGSIKVNVDMGSYGGTAATSATIYRNGALDRSINANGDYTINGLAGASTHSLYVVNNFGCRDSNNHTNINIPQYYYVRAANT